MNNSLPRSLMLKKQKEFTYVFEGKKVSSKFMCIAFRFIKQRRDTDSKRPPKMGISISKKVGTAPQRNYIKRIIREFYRTHKALFQGIDVLFIPKQGIADLNSSSINLEIVKLLNKRQVSK